MPLLKTSHEAAVRVVIRAAASSEGSTEGRFAPKLVGVCWESDLLSVTSELEPGSLHS